MLKKMNAGSYHGSHSYLFDNSFTQLCSCVAGFCGRRPLDGVENACPDALNICAGACEKTLVCSGLLMNENKYGLALAGCFGLC